MAVAATRCPSRTRLGSTCLVRFLAQRLFVNVIYMFGVFRVGCYNFDVFSLFVLSH